MEKQTETRTSADAQLQEAMQKAFQAQQAQRKALLVRRYAQLNRHAAKGQIVMAGSSLMEDFPIAELMPVSSDGMRIYNRGVGGFVTLELMEAIEPLILELAPSRLFLNIGSNDIAADTYRQEDLIHNVETILSQVRTHVPDCRIHLMAYYPVNADETFPGIPEDVRRFLFANRTNEAIGAANRAIAELAARTGCRYVDANRGLTDECGNLKHAYSIEGLHMYPEAYAVILENLRPYL